MSHDSNRLRGQVALFRQKAFYLQTQNKVSTIPLRRLLRSNMRVRQLLSIKLSNMCIITENYVHFFEDLKWISALVSSKQILITLRIWYMS
jgi:hypothetical protein